MSWQRLAVCTGGEHHLLCSSLQTAQPGLLLHTSRGATLLTPGKPCGCSRRRNDRRKWEMHRIVGPKFLTMPILQPWDSEEWYPSISIDWQVLVCGTERRNHRTKMTFNRVSFDLQAPVTHLLVWAEVLSVSQMQSGHFAPCCSTWSPRGNPSHPRTEAGTSPVGRKEEMLTLTPSLGHAKRSSWVAQFWAALSFGLTTIQAKFKAGSLHRGARASLFWFVFQKCVFYCSGSMCPFQHMHEKAAPCPKHISLNLSSQ